MKERFLSVLLPILFLIYGIILFAIMIFTFPIWVIFWIITGWSLGYWVFDDLGKKNDKI